MEVTDRHTGQPFTLKCDECEGTGNVCIRCAESAKFCDCPETEG
jgi:hypothetical protein